MFILKDTPHQLVEDVTVVLQHYKVKTHIVGVLEEKSPIEGSFKGRVLSKYQQGYEATFTKDAFIPYTED